MTKNTLFTLFLCFILPLALVAKGHDDEHNEKHALYCDGPYIFHDSVGLGARIVSVTPKGEIIDYHIDTLPNDWSFKVQTEDGAHRFEVGLHDIVRPESFYPTASKTYVVSDPHGNFPCFYSILRAGGVISEDYRWTFGDGHLVVIGDVMDRGVDVTPIYWLIYKLEAEAEAAGGRLSFLLGNHEVMVLNNKNRYTHEKYKALTDTLHISTSVLYGPHTELGRWLATRNTMMRIGTDLFVHAGLSPDFYEMDLPIDSVNAMIRRGLFAETIDETTHFLLTTMGPIWYRGLVKESPKYRPVSNDTLQLILERYGATRLYLGHTIFKQVTKFFGGKVICVNVNNTKAKEKKRPRAVMIADGKAVLYNDKGKTVRKL